MIEILQPGLYTTIQDLGRFGYRKYGVPVSGAMDQNSARLANHLIGNAESNALLEITLIGPSLKFNESCQIAITGAEFEPILNDLVVKNNKAINVSKGSTLKFGAVIKGMRAYLAIQGGFDSEIVMSSASYYPNITRQSLLKKGDKLFFGNISSVLLKPNDNPLYPTILDQQSLTVFKGPEFDSLSTEVQNKLLNSEFKISNQSNRMGCRLINKDTLFTEEIITSPVQPGTVQLTPSGQLIALGRDAQTTGGYARVLQLTKAAQDFLGQMQFENIVKFNLLAT